MIANGRPVTGRWRFRAKRERPERLGREREEQEWRERIEEAGKERKWIQRTVKKYRIK